MFEGGPASVDEHGILLGDARVEVGNGQPGGEKGQSPLLDVGQLASVAGEESCLEVWARGPDRAVKPHEIFHSDTVVGLFEVDQAVSAVLGSRNQLRGE